MYTSSKNTRENSDFEVNPHLQQELSQMDLQLMTNNTHHAQIHMTAQSQRIQDFFLLLSVCNTVVVSKHPHQDKMNSSGLYLDSSSQIYSSDDSPLVRNKQVPKKDNYVTPKHPVPTGATPPPSYNSTPVKKHRFLPLPFFGGTARTNSPTPSPGELRPIYEAESPDELALITAAYKYNCRLLKRMTDSVTLALPGEGLIEFQILNVLPFDPLRKRMSVILQHPFTKDIVLYCKGADSAIFPYLAQASSNESKKIIFQTQQQLNNYARKGLRVLVMAKKVLSKDEYQTWMYSHRLGELNLEEREQRIMESAIQIESGLELLGATGIEDRLQEGVPETISNLRKAGIIIWVITGDKQETAVNIAFSCHLFSYDMEIITVNSRSRETTEDTLKFHLEQIRLDATSRPMSPLSTWSSNSFFVRTGMRKKGLVIDGRTLSYILDRELDKTFLELAQHCNAVLCCRATPLQKASIVKLVKEEQHVLTLAIGDGANDVSMIQTADVGIGISGQEGMQAVMASDFAMAKFKYLERLLLVHGHWCYDRLARMVLYFFYKNAGIIFLIFWFQLYCGFSGTVVIDQLNIMLYNLFFTSLPPLIMGIYDQDAPSDLLLNKPRLYQQGIRSQVYKPYSFWVNISDAFYQSVVIFFFPMMILPYSFGNNGMPVITSLTSFRQVDNWSINNQMNKIPRSDAPLSGMPLFPSHITTVMLVYGNLPPQLPHVVYPCNCCICVWRADVGTMLHLAAMVLSIVVYYGFNIAYNYICISCPSLPNPYWVMQHTMGTSSYWLNILLVTVAALLPRLTVRFLQASLWPSDVAIALIAQRQEESAQEAGEFSVNWSRGSSISSIVRIGGGENHQQNHTMQSNTLTEVA
uniref:Phospholipid-transporting ATPase n=1 Tax=Strigamia maritima TaxID=126957 RepID=T1JA93_STRMM